MPAMPRSQQHPHTARTVTNWGSRQPLAKMSWDTYPQNTPAGKEILPTHVRAKTRIQAPPGTASITGACGRSPEQGQSGRRQGKGTHPHFLDYLVRAGHDPHLAAGPPSARSPRMGGTSSGAQGSHVSCGTWAALKCKFNSKMKQYGRLSFSQFYLFHNLPVLLH